MWKIFRDLKLKYKLFFVFAVLLYLTTSSWIFSFTTLKDIDDSSSRLETYSIPSLITTAKLKDSLSLSFSNAFDYVSTGNTEFKDEFKDNFTQAVAAEIELFQLAQTDSDFEFTQLFEDKINDINQSLTDLIDSYEQDPENFQRAKEISELGLVRDDFYQFLEEQVTVKTQDQVDQAADKIDKTVNRVLWYTLIVVGAVLIITLIIICLIRYNISRPLNRLTLAAEKMGRGEFEPVNMKGNDELGLFGDTFDKMGRDITKARHDLEEELVKTKELDKQKSEFLSIAAHQLRTPMAGLKWVLDMLLEEDLGPLTEEQKHHLERSVDNSNRMIKLINALLDVTKMESQKYQYRFEPVNFKEMAETIIKGLSSAAEKKQLKISLDMPAELPLVNADQQKINIAITNLLDNAIKYSPVGKEIKMVFKAEDDGMVISVADQGYGIPEKQQNQVFDKFFRGSNILKIETDYETIGTGLGLHLTKDIVEKHEGKIWFDSKENQGTIFYIKIPFNLKSAPLAESKAEPKEKGKRNLTREEIEALKKKIQAKNNKK